VIPMAQRKEAHGGFGLVASASRSGGRGKNCVTAKRVSIKATIPGGPPLLGEARPLVFRNIGLSATNGEAAGLGSSRRTKHTGNRTSNVTRRVPGSGLRITLAESLTHRKV
jgi:hypothetical protein